MSSIGNVDLRVDSENILINFLSPPPPPGGGALRFASNGGVPLKPPIPYPSLRVILVEKGTHY